VLAIAHGGSPVTIASTRAKVDCDFIVPHYIRFVVDDQPGIIARIAGHLADQQINIHAILQKPGFDKLRLPFVVTVEPCSSSALKVALTEIAKMDCLEEPPLDLQMLEEEPVSI
jgi:homoserine dehydrogenase